MVKGGKSKKKERGSSIRSDDRLPIVALGSSAGGLEAIEAFFGNAPPEADMAYVVITHLEPHHPSLLAEIISRSTEMTTVQVQDDMVVQKNKIYVIPPGKDMTIANGTLRLSSRLTGHEPFMPIDIFLRSLAEDKKEDAIAVILSGNGSDGSQGVRSVHGNLGMVMVQSPETAKYDSMPRSAIETGLVDYVLAPGDMPEMIIRYVHALRTMIQPPVAEPVESTDEVFRILSIVKRETGHDLSLYKKSTINRRIERRLSVHQLETKEQYASYLMANPKEVQLLFKEMLIEVTNFFRNPDAFESLKEALRKTVFDPKPEMKKFRAWVTGCSTGEEVYSIAIVLKELMEEGGKNLPVQIFGSDINEDAIDIARAGDYPLAIGDDVERGRLDKYFIKHENGYKVRKELREMAIFAPHDVTCDPPFLHLDLISCRNLLIYFEPALQKQVLEKFSIASNPGGILFLGESETINGFDDRFTAVVPKWKIYRRRPYVPLTSSREIDVPARPKKDTTIVRPKTPIRASMGEKAEKILLTEHTPPSLVVDEKNDVVHFHGRTDKYLEHPSGKASLSIRDLLREDIRYPVMSAITESRTTGKTVLKEAVRIHTNGDSSFLNVIVRPLEKHGQLSDVLVVFDHKTVPKEILSGERDLSITPNVETRMAELERELRYTKDSLKGTIEELEAANEELMSTNEELQSNNEELQSVAEESETGKEELNSMNEELLTVNTELERKNQELSRINSDMRNLLNSVDEATIFLDFNLKIRRFTPQMEQIMSLLPGDVGRPIHDIAINLRSEDLVRDVKEVLDNLNRKEKEVQTKDGHWYKLKVLPYRTVENVIDGVVVTFRDIDDQKRVQQKLSELALEARASQEYSESIVNTVKEPLLIVEKNLVVRSVNSSFVQTFDSAPEHVQGHPLGDIIDGAFKPLIGRLNQLSSTETELENMSMDIVVPNRGKMAVDVTARKLLMLKGKSRMILVHLDMGQ